MDEEPGRLQSMGLQRVGHNWATSLSCIGEGNGNPLQCSCLENPREGGAWWAAIYGVAQSRTRLKRLSSSSSCPRWTPHDWWGEPYGSQVLNNYKKLSCAGLFGLAQGPGTSHWSCRRQREMGASGWSSNCRVIWNLTFFFLRKLFF